MFPLLALPSELVTRILLNLNLRDLLACQLTCQTLRTIYAESAELQYSVEMEVAGVENNPDSTMSISGRLSLLKSREAAFDSFSIDFRKPIPIPLRTSGIYDLTGGIYLLGERNADPSFGDKLNFLRLPSREADEIMWTTLQLDRRLIDIGLAPTEHDLLAVVTRKASPTNSISQLIEVLFYKMSDNTPHPNAKIFALPLLDESSSINKYSLSIEIVGRQLVLLITHPQRDGSDCDYFFVVDWKAGVIKMQGEIDKFTYLCVSFLSPEIIIMANVQVGAFDFLHIPDHVGEEPAPFRIFHSLLLPLLGIHNWIRNISFRAEPNPFGQDSQDRLAIEYRTSPFYSIAENAIMLVNIGIVESLFNLTDFTMIVHRNALLNIIPPPLDVTDIDDDDTDEIAFAAVPWHEWGPSITRWLNSGDVSTGWITTSNGQRYARIAGHDGEGQPIHILDFNPYHVWRAKYDLARGVFSPNRRLVTEEDEVSLPQAAFSEEITSHLPYVETVSEDSYPYNAVLLDEERIIGLMAGADAGERSIEVVHFGGDT